MPDLDVLFIGGVIPRDGDRTPVDLTRYGVPDNAANVYQWNMITGLERNLGRSVRIVSVPFLSPAARVGDPLRIPGFAWAHAGGADDVSVGFVNAFGLRNITRELALRRQLRRALAGPRPPGRGRLLLVVYAMHGPFLQQLAMVKRERPDSEVCLVVPDLPEHMRDPARTSLVVRLLKRVDIWRNQACLAHVDRYVLVSSHQAQALGISDDRFVVVEGMVDPRAAEGGQPESAPDPAPSEFTVVYTGRLDHRYGLGDLVDALDHVGSPDLRLVLCGDGDAVRHIRARADRDPRIVHLGQVSHEISVALQRRADLLINPRPGTADFTRYSFPSKNLEYLLTGKPVLAYPNEGTPPEYDDHLIYIPEPGPQGIASAIESVMAMPDAERRSRGERGRRFAESSKSVEGQMRKVLTLVGGDR